MVLWLVSVSTADKKKTFFPLLIQLAIIGSLCIDDHPSWITVNFPWSFFFFFRLFFHIIGYASKSDVLRSCREGAEYPGRSSSIIFLK